ncbi:MAG: acyl-CoA dehydrogenase, partial [Alteromonas sp.]|nr:acyl-CoA dehydrogenase [Alteromonas sp.]
MSDLVWILIVLVALAVCAYQRCSLSNTVITGAAALLIATLFGSLGFFSWVFFALLAVPFVVPSVRIPYLTKPMLVFYRKVMPEMSSTEQEAIDAGTV